MHNYFEIGKLDHGERRILIRALRNLGYKKRRSKNISWKYIYHNIFQGEGKTLERKHDFITFSKYIGKFEFKFSYVNHKGSHHITDKRHRCMSLYVSKVDDKYQWMTTVFSTSLINIIEYYKFNPIDISKDPSIKYRGITTDQAYILSIIINKELQNVIDEIINEERRQPGSWYSNLTDV